MSGRSNQLWSADGVTVIPATLRLDQPFAKQIPVFAALEQDIATKKFSYGEIRLQR